MSGTATATGTLETALRHAETLLRQYPELAEQQVLEILKVHPDLPEALSLKGRAEARQGQTDQAITTLKQAVRTGAEQALAWRSLAELLASTGDRAGADHAQAQAIRTSVNEPRLRQAANALCANDLPVAERILKPYLKQHPTDVAAIRMLAELAGRIGRNRDSEALLRRAVELAPGFTPARFNLATVLYRQAKTPEALAQLDVLMEDDPDNPAYRNLLAASLTRTGNVEEALPHFRKALDANPGLTKVWLSYGHALKTAGKQQDSVDAYRRCIAQQPGYGEAWWSLANLKTIRFDADDVASMRKALELPRISDEDRLHLHFSLGKALEDAKEFELAFRHYEEGNRLRLKLVPFNPERITSRVDRMIAQFNGDFLKRREGQGCPAPDPIFVLGMPRSGSTLVEQILASHPLVEGTQELGDIQLLSAQVGGRDELYPENLAKLSPGELAQLGADYLQRTRIQRHTDRPFFIDKMPNNWMHAGFIRLILPNAKIIDTRRHPMACCFSNYKQHFARGQAFAYDQQHMGRYYADYVRLMDHFDQVAPGMVYRVWHEALVEDPEHQIRSLLDFAGLPFDPACLRFHENDRAVRTASSEQVRRPINRDGIDKWRNFEPFLGPMRDALGPVFSAYPHQ